jgi:hypothetical protein
MSTMTRTNHFTSFATALRYFEPYGDDKQSLQRKLDEGLIAIGSPPAREGETIGIDTVEGRYFYEVDDKKT